MHLPNNLWEWKQNPSIAELLGYFCNRSLDLQRRAQEPRNHQSCCFSSGAVRGSQSNFLWIQWIFLRTFSASSKTWSSVDSDSSWLRRQMSRVNYYFSSLKKNNLRKREKHLKINNKLISEMVKTNDTFFFIYSATTRYVYNTSIYFYAKSTKHIPMKLP